MKFLPKAGIKDWFAYGVTIVLLVVCAYVGFFVWDRIRIMGSLYCGYVNCFSAQIRVMKVVTLLVPGIAWAIYAMVLETRLLSAVTDARQRKMHTSEPAPGIKDKPIALWLWKNNLQLVPSRFIKLLAIPVVIGTITYIISEILIKRSLL